MNFKSFLVATPFWRNKAMALVRMLLGVLLIYHGQEVFNTGLMKEYAAWDSFKGTNAVFMVYAGKSAELIAGISLLLGLCTRIGSVLIIGTFLYITFLVGGGRFWYEDQHPFMFVMLGLIYFFNGPGAWSLDKIVFKPKDDSGG